MPRSFSSIAASAEVVAVFLRLGLVSFGGPIAHLGYFHREFVIQRRWLDEREFTDLVALCQFLPGPSSSQVAFALGLRRAGIVGAVAASISFLLPSAAIMILLACGIDAFGSLGGMPSLVSALKLAAVAIVAQAVLTMRRTLAPDPQRIFLAAAGAFVCLSIAGPVTHLALIACGLTLGSVFFRTSPAHAGDAPAANPFHYREAIIWIAAYCALLMLPTLAAPSLSVSVFERFFLAGSLVFGGGHVVLPLLEAHTVQTGWISADDFTAGYGAAQALPGPLFSFAGYLAALVFRDSNPIAGGVLGLLAIFLPGWLLVAAALPMWNELRTRIWAQAALKGANAVVVGILFAALCSPLISTSIHSAREALLALAGLVLLERFKAPTIVVVAAMVLVSPLSETLSGYG